MISFVLLIKIRSHHDHDELERLKNIQLKSLRKYLDLSVLKSYIVVASGADIEVIRPQLLESFPEFPFIFVDEDLLCPSLAGISGWTKQMILKLCAARVVETECYLTLDTDVLLTKPLGREDVYREGKLLFQMEKLSSHEKWWKSSSRMLKLDFDRLRERKAVMGVTPAYLVTELCRRLLDDLGELHSTGDSAAWLLNRRLAKKKTLNQLLKKALEWAPPLAGVLPQHRLDEIETCDWTEYTLYWAYLVKMGLVDRYYVETDLQIYGNCIWAEGDLKRDELRELLERTFGHNEKYHFSIVQSSIKHLDQDHLAEVVGEYLAEPPDQSKKI